MRLTCDLFADQSTFEVNSSKTSDLCLIAEVLVTESYEKHGVNFIEVNHRGKESFVNNKFPICNTVHVELT